MKKIQYLYAVLVLLCSTNIYSQAYDGEGDYKLLLGYTHVGSLNGAELKFDRAWSDLVSSGGKFTFLFNVPSTSNDEFEKTQNAFASFDVGLFLNFHFSETFKLEENIDPYIGLDGSIKTLGAHAGLKYHFTETIGLYVEYQYSFSGSLMTNLAKSPDADSDKMLNYFGKQNSISAGISINL